MTVGLVITTRLGVQFEGRTPQLREEVEERLRLLRGSVLPTLSAVRDLQPTWVVQTAEAHFDYVSAFVATVEEDLRDSVECRVVKQRGEGQFDADDLDGIPRRHPTLLCCRLDSDDYYMARALRDALRKAEHLPQGSLVDFPRGFLIDTRSGRATRFSYLAQGPFYGIVTDPDEPLAAHGDHTIARSGRVAVSVRGRSWLQLVHNTNDSTQFDGRGFVYRARTARREMLRETTTRPRSEIALKPLDLVPVRAPHQKKLRTLLALRSSPNQAERSQRTAVGDPS